MVQNWTSPASLITSCFSAKNEALHAFSIQEVTSLADSYDSPLICADMEVSIKTEFLTTQHTEMQIDETYLCAICKIISFKPHKMTNWKWVENYSSAQAIKYGFINFRVGYLQTKKFEKNWDLNVLFEESVMKNSINPLNPKSD